MSSDDDAKDLATEHMVDYDRHSHMQSNLVRSRKEWLKFAVSKTGLQSPEFRLLDLGCGPGHTAIEAVKPSIEAYRQLSPDGTIAVCHGDQPHNDWNALFALIGGKSGYLIDKNIRTEASVGSFYDVMASPGSVSIATCFVASHWLSRAMLITSPGTVWYADLTGDARSAFMQLAQSDWTRFLRSRAIELTSGGCVIVSTLASIPDPNETNGIRGSARHLYRAIHKVAAGMVDDGLLSKEALDRFIFPLWFPTVDDVLNPILENDDLAAAFDVLEASVEDAAVNPQDAYGDYLAQPDEYAELYAGYVRGFGESSLRLHLFDRCAATQEESDRLTHAFFERFEALYRKEPGRYASETLTLTLVLQRR
ncbi:S-adenosylmethionine-dependent carboxyl methyltransferase [Roseibium hamelinense]|uniref:S-adenosylmethionine-dependent carboxyl methyltransferase n=1 Tax=Roseibium hamelinense TaxID=150831 RepID=A0A562TAY5_9HYPH|nr:hypothetical protein [Roseibium hamelinense]TWI90418.1 S-adenosylmethionine-dependent carboxyl methyltransferase [Roseibium hamelinense]